MKTKIYTLIDPRTGDRRYVGRTVQSLAQRLRAHDADARKKTNKRATWIKELKSIGLSPQMVLLDEVPEDKARSAEVEWTLKLMAEGCDLLNDGIGRGGCQHPKRIVTWTPELDSMLGNVADSIIAEQIGTSRKSVTYRREKLGIPASFDRTRNTPPPYMGGHNRIALSEEIIAQLGTMPDYQLAKKAKVSKEKIMRERYLRNVPSFSDSTGNNGKFKKGDRPRRWLKEK
jgi:hypothetical protein